MLCEIDPIALQGLEQVPSIDWLFACSGLGTSLWKFDLKIVPTFHYDTLRCIIIFFFLQATINFNFSKKVNQNYTRSRVQFQSRKKTVASLVENLAFEIIQHFWRWSRQVATSNLRTNLTHCINEELTSVTNMVITFKTRCNA